MKKEKKIKKTTGSYAVAKQWVRCSQHDPLVTYKGKSLLGDTKEMCGVEAMEWLEDIGSYRFHNITRIQYTTEAIAYTKEQMEKINKGINP